MDMVYGQIDWRTYSMNSTKSKINTTKDMLIGVNLIMEVISVHNKICTLFYIKKQIKSFPALLYAERYKNK